MKFAQLLEKYKNHTATPEEQEIVEEELQKNELINEYLSSQMLLSADLLFDLPPLEQEKNQVRRSVNRRFRRMTLLCVSILLAVILLVVFVGLPFYNSLFYNPLKVSKGVPDLRIAVDSEPERSYFQSFHPFFLNTRAFLELHCPGQYLVDADVYPMGFGNYRVKISTQNAFYGANEYLGEIHRGHQPKQQFTKLFFQDYQMGAGVFYERGSQNVAEVDENGIEHFEQMEDSRSYYRSSLPELPKSTYLSAYVSFDRDLSMEELLELTKSWESCSIVWAAVRANGDTSFNEIGFNLSTSGFVLETTEEFDAMFPHLSFQYFGQEHQPQDYETHFKSLLKYMTYQGEYLEAMANVNNYSPSFYQECLDYVEENGVKIYGAYVYGNRDEMIELEQQDYIHSFRINNVKLSLIG